MKPMTFTTLCLVAALATAPAMAASPDKAGRNGPNRNSECTSESHGKTKSNSRDRRKAKTMDCMVVKGYPSEDGRAALRRSLEKEAKEGLTKVIRPTLKDLLGERRTS